MDPEHTFIRVQERFSRVLTPRVRAYLEYIYLFIAITLFCVLVVMHANYVQQKSYAPFDLNLNILLIKPGCSSEFAGIRMTEAQLIQIKISSAGLWSQHDSDSNVVDVTSVDNSINELEVSGMDADGLTFSAANLWLNWIRSNVRKGKLALKFWRTDMEPVEHLAEGSVSSQSFKPTDSAVNKIDKEEARNANLTKFPEAVVQWLENRTKAFEPTYLYTMEKGYFLLPEADKSRHNIRTFNISISAQHPCFGNRWQQLLINRFVGYDTILMNSLLHTPGQGYLYNCQTKEFYNLSYAQEPPEGPAKFGDYLVTKCGVLMMSLFVFFTTTMSVSFTLRETQARMLKFTVQLQHHAQHRLPTFQLIFVHVIESLVFVPIMIGILFFLFEFYDDQLLAFLVLILVWLCELFTLISVRTPISMKFFPRFFLLYFLVFHIYFFSYAYGFSYMALGTAAAFVQHLILYFWNHFEVPALQRFIQNRRTQLQQQPDFHITSSTILASTLHITRLNTRNPSLPNTDATSGPGLRPGSNQAMPPTNRVDAPGPERSENNNPDRVGNTMEIPGQPDLQQPETGPNPGSMNSFSSLLLWILGGASSEGLNSFLSMFRDVREQGQVFADSQRQENGGNQHVQ
ncbi:Membralin-like protein [Citrus sinensis]|uniref:Membralin-like protein n=1 Tax=Citrus sinensis TaxID=2711 RepID=A0ACB8KAX0_CITSI|nr:Membralin-like protein [Citrus sinensis]